MRTPKKPNLASRLTVRTLLSAFLLLAMTAWRAQAQIPGTLDLSFDPGNATGTNYSGVVHALLPLPDGSVVVGGEFTMAQGAARDNIVHLLPNGATDTNFLTRITRMGGYASVEALARQGTKILVGGKFDSVNGLTRRGLARLNGDGTLDTTFNPSLGSSSQFNSILLQPDGKIVLAGFFSLTVSNAYRSDMVRLDANGNVDLSFDAGSYGVGGGFPYTVALQSDGRFLVGGFFAGGSYANYPTNLARLHPTGALDTNYWPGFDTFGIVYGVAMQADGKAILAGDFDNVSGFTRYGYARMNTNGTLDLSFELKDAGTKLFSAGGRLACAAVQYDQKVLLAGMFTPTGTLWGDRVVRFLPDGTADVGFVSVGTSSGSIETIALQADGKLLVGGRFQDYGGLVRRGLVRLHGDSIPQPPRIALSRQPGGAMRLDVTNPASQTIVLQTTTNLYAAQWTPLATNALGTNRVLFSDTNASKFPRRFYRASQVNP